MPLDEIGTDPTRFRGLSPKLGEYYNQTLVRQGEPTATATWRWSRRATRPRRSTASGRRRRTSTTARCRRLHDVLNSKARPKIFTRSYQTDREDYDEVKVGWKVQVLGERRRRRTCRRYERRKVYDTTQPGRGNGGHTFGDDLSDEERRAVIEYLKTL